jgi:hypothetical protein
MPRTSSTALALCERWTAKGVGPGGADIYTVKFERGSLERRIFLDAEGKVA